MVIGWLGLLIGVVAWLLAAWLLWRLARMRRRAKTGLPTRPLMVMPPNRPGDRPALHINGTLLGAPALTAPATGRPCSIWELALAEIIPADYDSNEGVNHLWVGFRCADLTIECDARVVFNPNPARGRPYDVTPGVRTVTVTGGQVQLPHPGGTDPGLSFFRGARLLADAAALERAGAPAELVRRVRDRPERFYLLEGSIAPGELVTLVQQTRVTGEVDPSAPAMLGVMGYEGDLAAQGSSTVGCLSVVLVIAALVAGAVGTVALAIQLA